jgi:uncharacterized protein
MKKFLWILLAVLLVMGMTVTAAAADMPLLFDGADLLEDWEEADLLALLERVSDEGGMDVVVVTVDSTEGASPRDFADDYYDQNGFGQGPDRDGLVLLVSMEERDWWISTCGEAIYAFTDTGIDYISEQFLPFLSDGYYALAFEEYANRCGDYIRQAKTGQPYDVGNLPQEPFAPGAALFLSFIVAFVIALIYVCILRLQLRSVKKQTAASVYVRPGSLNVTHARDIFLYRTVSKTARETSSGSSGGSSTHRSASGVSHGGRGGKF